MDKLRFWGIIGAAWRGAFQAIRRNEVLVLLVFALLVCLRLTFSSLTLPIHHVPGTPRLTQAGLILNLLQDALESLVSAPLMLTVHRYILCGETQTPLSNTRRLATFGVYLLFVRVMSSLPADIESLQIPHSHAQIWLLLVTMVSWIISVRLLLVYPAAALDTPFALSDGWNRSRGHWWYIVGVMVCGLGTLLLVGFGLLLALHPHPLQPLPPERAVLEVIVGTAVNVIATAFGAGLLSELYRKFGPLHEHARYPEPIRRRSGGSAGIGIAVAVGALAVQQIWPQSHAVMGLVALGFASLFGLVLAYLMIAAKRRRR